jgi:hypothetical protein
MHPKTAKGKAPKAGKGVGRKNKSLNVETLIPGAEEQTTEAVEDTYATEDEAEPYLEVAAKETKRSRAAVAGVHTLHPC